MDNDNINNYVPSILNPRGIKKPFGDITLTQDSVVSRSSLSLKKNNTQTSYLRPKKNKVLEIDKENRKNIQNSNQQKEFLESTKLCPIDRNFDEHSFDFSFIKDLIVDDNEKELSLVSRHYNFSALDRSDGHIFDDKIEISKPVAPVSSKTELNKSCGNNSNKTIICDIEDKLVFSASFELINCEKVNIHTKHTNIKNIFIQSKNNNLSLDCDLVESSQPSLESELDANMNQIIPQSPTKRRKSIVSVNLEIKKKKLSSVKDSNENSRVLILNTDAIERFSNVIIQPPNYKLVKQKISNKSKLKINNTGKSKFGCLLKNGKRSTSSDNLKQQRIDSFVTKADVFKKLKVSNPRTLVESNNGSICDNCGTTKLVREDAQEMSKNSGVVDGIKLDRCCKGLHKTNWKDYEVSPKSTKVSSRRSNESPKPQDLEQTRIISPKGRTDSSASYSPRKNLDAVHFNVTTKPKSNKSSPHRNIPYFKIVAGTHFAVDAFSYGDIPNVKHYFLTHFHSDHYSGLRRSFNKILYCTKITGELCVSRLGVSSKCIHVLKVNEAIEVEGVEVTPVDANHCPGAVMLAFTLPSGKTILHTGDFRASPTMESYPVFWNKDIHSIYLDTTYCNPRYDFPTQEESLEMALYLLRQKKMALEKVGKKFSTVLIVCGTYTIGKEKFFQGVSRRVGCAVWACPEKDRVLQVVEGRSFSHSAPHACQLHVVPMRDLTYEKLRSYLESLQGAFSEVVAFKPSGWENGKNTTLEKDMVTIHGIPYSEHSSFSELIRFVKFIKPKQVVPTVDISGGIKAVQKYFPCPLVCKEDFHSQSKVTDYFSIQHRQQISAVT